MNLDTDLMCFTKIDSKWITDSNIKYRPIKNFRKNTGENLWSKGQAKRSLDLTQKHN